MTIYFHAIAKKFMIPFTKYNNTINHKKLVVLRLRLNKYIKDFADNTKNKTYSSYVIKANLHIPKSSLRSKKYNYNNQL